MKKAKSQIEKKKEKRSSNEWDDLEKPKHFFYIFFRQFVYNGIILNIRIVIPIGEIIL